MIVENINCLKSEVVQRLWLYPVEYITDYRWLDFDIPDCQQCRRFGCCTPFVSSLRLCEFTCLRCMVRLRGNTDVELTIASRIESWIKRSMFFLTSNTTDDRVDSAVIVFSCACQYPLLELMDSHICRSVSPHKYIQ